jgi:hypothetical protein
MIGNATKQVRIGNCVRNYYHVNSDLPAARVCNPELSLPSFLPTETLPRRMYFQPRRPRPVPAQSFLKPTP